MGIRYFIATDKSTNSGTELWSTNGTSPGTGRVTDINPGPASSGAANFFVSGNITYFTADDGVHGTEIWTYDSTTNTTARMDQRGTAPGADYTSVVASSITLAAGSRLVFTATDNQSTNTGTELWVSNTTAASTVRVADINPGPGSSNPANYIVAGQLVYFTATDGNHGTQLWAYNPSAAVSSTNPARMDPGGSTAAASYTSVVPSSITVVGARVLFVATDNTTNSGTELWSTSGTSGSTGRVQDINPGPGSSNPANFLAVNSTQAYFTADDGVHGVQLWGYNATTNTTLRLDKFAATSGASADYTSVVPSSILNVGSGKVIFVATDNSTNGGKELFSSDGTVTGTKRVADINPGPGNSNPANFVNAGDSTTYFTADDGVHGIQVWTYDSGSNTVARMDQRGTAPGADYKDVIPSSMTVAGSRLVFTATDNQSTNTGTELWVTDGSSASTRRVADINPGSGSSNPANFVVLGTKVFFTATDGNHGVQLWVFDAATTLAPVRLDPGGSTATARYTNVVPSSITLAGSRVLFVATDNTTNSGAELWSADGTAANTARVLDINAGPGSSNPANFVFNANTGASPNVFFTADDGLHGTELWSYDTATNTASRMDKFANTNAGLPADYTAPIMSAATTYSIVATDAVKLANVAGQISYAFKVVRTGDVTTAATLTYSAAGTGANAATASSFVGGVLPAGIVTFATGELSKTININVAGNTGLAQNADFTVTLGVPSGVSPGNIGFGTPSAAGTLLTNVSTLSIAATNASRPEGNSGTTPFTFTVTRAGSTTAASSATWAVTSSGSEPNAADFTGGTLPSGTVNFAAGDTSQTITVNVAGDTTVESDEGFTVTLSNATGATITTTSATGTILNDDVTPVLSGTQTVQRLDKGIQRLLNNVSTLSQQVRDSEAAQIDASTLSRDALKLQFISDASSRTTAALVSYDYNYGTTPSSGGLDFLTNFTRSLPAQGFSDLNVWVNISATAATQPTTAVTKLYGGLSNDAFVDAAYKDIFGTNASSQAHSVFLSSMDFYGRYVAQTPGLSPTELAGGTRGAVVGVMLHEATLVVAGTAYANAVSRFYDNVAAGTESYGTSLR